MADPITRSGSNYSIPRDANRVPAVGGVLAADGKTVNPLELDSSGNLLVNVAVGGSTPTLPTTVVNGQQTVSGTATALPSHTLVNGVLIENLSTNSVSVFVGSSSVTTSGSTGGYELQVGATTSAAVANTNGIYVICATGSPVISFIGS